MRTARRTPPYRASRRATIARRLHDQLRWSIRSGSWPNGTLPSEDSLVRDFSASRNAVREALDMLRQEGLVSRVPSIGTTVDAPLLAHRIDRLVTLREALPDGSERTTGRVVDIGLIPAGPYVARQLGLDDDASCVLIERVVVVDDEPIALRTSYFPPEMADALLPSPPRGDLFHFLEHRLGHRLGPSSATIEAHPVDALTAELLQMSTRLPVLFRETITRCVEGRPLELSHTRYRSDRVALGCTIERSPDEAPSTDVPSETCPLCQPDPTPRDVDIPADHRSA